MPSSQCRQSEVVEFQTLITAGAVKFYAAQTITDIASQLCKATERAPLNSVSLIDLNPSDIGDVFKRR